MVAVGRGDPRTGGRYSPMVSTRNFVVAIHRAGSPVLGALNAAQTPSAPALPASPHEEKDHASSAGLDFLESFGNSEAEREIIACVA